MIPAPEWIGNERGTEYLELTFTYFSQMENREIPRVGAWQREGRLDFETKCRKFNGGHGLHGAEGTMGSRFGGCLPVRDPKVCAAGASG
jgi:hypothetical protein